MGSAANGLLPSGCLDRDRGTVGSAATVEGVFEPGRGYAGDHSAAPEDAGAKRGDECGRRVSWRQGR